MTIVAYTYDAAYHCPACTRQDFTRSSILRVPGFDDLPLDDQGLYQAIVDRHDNPVMPVFSWDAMEGPLTCDDCLGTILD